LIITCGDYNFYQIKVYDFLYMVDFPEKRRIHDIRYLCFFNIEENHKIFVLTFPWCEQCQYIIYCENQGEQSLLYTVDGFKTKLIYHFWRD